MTVGAAPPETIEPRSSASAASERFLVLDGLRGLAAFAVILDHVPSGRLEALTPFRFISVDFFFVLSGFVLAHAYSRRLEAGWSAVAFMRTRLIRLYPLYLAALVIAVVTAIMRINLAADGQMPSFKQVWSPQELATWVAFGIAFLPQFVQFGAGTLFPLNPPAWSLFFELVANFVYALIARFLNWRLLGSILAVSAVMVVVSLFNHRNVGGPGWLWEHFDAGVSRVTFAFFAGVAIYRLREAVTIPAIPIWLSAALFIVAISAPIPAEWTAAYSSIATIILMPLLVALSAGARVSGPVAWLCATLGLLSYGVYVLHVPIRDLFLTPGFEFVNLSENTRSAVTVAIIAAALAAFLHYFYDTPIRRWLSRRFSGKTNREKSAR